MPQTNHHDRAERQDPDAEQLVAGRNPVLELLRSERPVDHILMASGARATGSLPRLEALAREQGVPVKEVARERLDALCPGVNHQGVAAVAAACGYVELEDLFEIAAARDEPLFVIVADGIEDPHNLGAILRTADACGAHGVVVPKRHGVGLTAAVMRSSAGAALHLPVARVPNLPSALETLKERGAWVYAADMGGEDWCAVDYSGAVALVVGSEGKGVSRLMRERSDRVVSLPMLGKVNSLNASVAAGIVMYEIARQRLSIKAK